MKLKACYAPVQFNTAVEKERLFKQLQGIIGGSHKMEQWVEGTHHVIDTNNNWFLTFGVDKDEEPNMFYLNYRYEYNTPEHLKAVVSILEMRHIAYQPR